MGILEKVTVHALKLGQDRIEEFDLYKRYMAGCDNLEKALRSKSI